MAFRVEISPQAFQDLDEVAQHIIRQVSFERAERWFRGLMRSIRSLQEMPTRCPMAAKSEELGRDVRVLFHGRKNRAFKIYFDIRDESVVRVFHIRHWAQHQLNASEIIEFLDQVE
jgi:plasmid stabilization system protein ParE